MEKITSRKFIIALLSAISGVAISLSSIGGSVGRVCAIISAIIPAITYIIVEGVVDAKAVGLITDATKEVVEIVTEDEDEDKEDEEVLG